MSKRQCRIAGVLSTVGASDLDPHYLGFFGCFNEQRYFQAHEVLEELWLANRSSGEAAFYKGLIQLAGAFVHIQKDRRGPAEALFRLARGNLQQYPPVFRRLEIAAVLMLIEEWLECLPGAAAPSDLLTEPGAPTLNLAPF